MNWFGLGKKRTRFGKWIDKKGISQQDISKKTGVNRNTISKLCNDKEYKPKISTGVKITKPFNKNYEDFWGK